MRFAFGIEGYLDRQIKDDERYVKIITRLVLQKDGLRSEKLIPHRRCKPDDFNHFAPAAPDSEGLLSQYRENPNRNLFCLDWEIVGD